MHTRCFPEPGQERPSSRRRVLPACPLTREKNLPTNWLRQQVIIGAAQPPHTNKRVGASGQGIAPPARDTRLQRLRHLVAE